MLALRLYGPNDIRLDDIPVPEITEDEILLKVDAAAVCGTDVRMWQNGYAGVDEEERMERAKKALEAVGLGERLEHKPMEMSGGQRQRLLLAATLAVHPEIIVLDEPVSAMDPDGARSLYKLVDKIHKQYGTTIIAVEHRVDYVLPYVTDMIVLNAGELVAADAFEAAAPKMYENPALRPLLPSLWQIKLGLEEKLGVDLGDWRSEEDALTDFRTYGIVAAEGRAD